MRFPHAALAVIGLVAPALADDAPGPGTPTVPATREDLKRALEGSKKAAPRLPLPAPTAEQRAKAAAPGSRDWGVVNNGLMRNYYLGPELTAGAFPREPEPGMTLGHRSQTMLFWIVSRANNCTYCMGHQESKLAADGLSEDRIAGLDGDWAEYTPAERAAFAFTRKLTFEPNAMTDADVRSLRAHYDDAQITEIVYVVGAFNAMNRWTGALRIPQEEHRVYLTPTSDKFTSMLSAVAPLPAGARAPACARPASRPPLESAAEVEAALSAARSRTPRLPLVDEAGARALYKDAYPGTIPEYARLLAAFPRVGVARAAGHRVDDERGDPGFRRLKAQMAYIAARQDRAWYAVGHAMNRMAALKLPDAHEPASLVGDWSQYDPATRAAFHLARKLTVDPARIDDADVADLRKYYDDKQVAELIHHVTECAFFDRLTEAAGLRLE